MTLGNGGIFRQLPGETYQSSSRQHYLSGTQISVGQQALFPDQRGQVHNISAIPCIAYNIVSECAYYFVHAPAIAVKI